VALVASGIVLAAAFGSMSVIANKKLALQRALRAYPYQTQGYVPGYVPGYIPGGVPGYSVPGYVPGYGTFIRLTPVQFLKEQTNWLRSWEQGKKK
jgi:hypothetical protein